MDFKIENHGTIYLFRPLTASAQEWVEEHVEIPGWDWLGNGFGVEHRYAEPLIEGILDAGFEIDYEGIV